SGTTLVLNVTSTAGLGTWTFWWIATQSATTILNNYNNGAGNNNEATPLILVQQNQAGNTEIAGIHFETRPTSSSTMIGLRTNAYIAPKTLIHDCWFSMGNGSGSAAIFAATNQGLVWNCSFDDTFSQLALGLQFKWEDSFWMRGGTGVITDNILPAMSSTAWGDKANIPFSVLNISRNTGGYPCRRDYPAPH